jgi:type IV pilus assembly protein PilV
MNTRQYRYSFPGFTLLEVMIALLIFSIGLLGLAGLLGTSLQNNKTADLRSVAIIAAHDMADRIRANQRGSSNDYDNVQVPSGPLSAPSPDCITAVCTSPAQIAAEDIYEWQTSLNKLLPSGQGSVTRASAASPFIISVFWDEARNGANKTDCTNAAGELKCYQLGFLP